MTTLFIHQPHQIIHDRYQLGEVLGQGGVGTTYQAIDLVSQQAVAIKVVSLRQMKDWKALDLIDREAKILQAIDHPKIPKYIDSFEIDTPDNRAFYLVQELAPGKPLSQWIEEGWQPDEDDVQEIAQQIMRILTYLQSLTPAVIHRDIKPQNIIRHAEGKLYLVDFGAVQDTFRHTVTGGSTVVGTLGYMAPEQFRGQATLTTDLYGLGMTMLFLLTRQDPVELPEKKFRIDFRSCVRLSPHVADWLDRMIAPSAEARFSSAHMALAVLQGRQSLPKQISQDETTRYHRVQVTKTEDRLLIRIAPAGLAAPAMQLLGAVTTIVLAMSIFLLSILFFSPSGRNLISWWTGTIILLPTVVIWYYSYLVFLGLFSPTQITFDRQMLRINQPFGRMLHDFSIRVKQLNSIPFWWWGVGQMHGCFWLSMIGTWPILFGFFLDPIEAKLITKHWHQFCSENQKGSR
jgi:eukaryotic-like serine/threonine-protein kinase